MCKAARLAAAASPVPPQPPCPLYNCINSTPPPPCPPLIPTEVALAQRDAAELVADRKPVFLTLTAGDKGSHFLLIEVRLFATCWSSR